MTTKYMTINQSRGVDRFLKDMNSSFGENYFFIITLIAKIVFHSFIDHKVFILQKLVLSTL